MMRWLSHLLGGANRARTPKVFAQLEPDLGIERSSVKLTPVSEGDAFRPPEPDLTTGASDALRDDALDGSTSFENDEEDIVAGLDEDDPTLGRYEALDQTTPSQQKLADMRAQAERKALSAPHRINVWDVTGPGSLAEISAHLERQGRLTSQIKNDPETGPYILYEPVDRDHP